MTVRERFPPKVVAAVDEGMAIGVRAGTTHRYIGIWAVVVEGRIFVRSWSQKPSGWYHAFLHDPNGFMTVRNRAFAVRACRTRSERIKDAVSRAYRSKYDSPGSSRYVKDLCGARCRASTTELTPRSTRK